MVSGWCIRHPKDGFLRPSCLHPAFILPSSCLHPAFILPPSCPHPVLILPSSCPHPVLILASSWLSRTGRKHAKKVGKRAENKALHATNETRRKISAQYAAIRTSDGRENDRKMEDKHAVCRLKLEPPTAWREGDVCQSCHRWGKQREKLPHRKSLAANRLRQVERCVPRAAESRGGTLSRLVADKTDGTRSRRLLHWRTARRALPSPRFAHFSSAALGASRPAICPKVVTATGGVIAKGQTGHPGGPRPP